jgi:hypothetical protein
LAPRRQAWYPPGVKSHHKRIVTVALALTILGWLAWTILLVPADLTQQ